MDTATARTPALQVFEDALGTRHHADAAAGEPLEVLELRDEFSTDAFETALRERVAALANFRSTWFSQVRSVQRIKQTTSKVFVVYDRVPGARLSTVLAVAREPRVPLDVNATLCLIRQLLTAVALLHEKLPNVAHGAISAERVIITPKARLVVADHVLGNGLEQLQWAPERYWNDLRIALPPSLEIAFDQRADVMQIGVLALELLLGRSITPSEYPDRLQELTGRAFDTAHGSVKAMTGELEAWLQRMLQVDPVASFASAVEAWEELEQVLVGSDNRASFAALESVMAEYARRSSANDVGTPSVAVAPEVRHDTRVTPPLTEAATFTATDDETLTVDDQPGTPVDLLASMDSSSESDDSEQHDAAAFALPSQVAQKPRANEAEAPVTFAPNSMFAAPGSVTSASWNSPVQEEGTPVKTTSKGYLRWIAAAAVLILLAGGGAIFGRKYFVPSAAAEAPGTLVVSTNPAGVNVIVDGQPRGVTPLTVELAPGAHELKLETEGGPRVIPFTVTAGSTVSQTLELPKASPITGQLTIRSEPAGARVSVDGTPSGTTPITIPGLAPGTHKVVLESDITSVSQEVIVEAGATASLVVPMTAPQGVPMSGWISVQAPAEVQVFEDGRLVGNSQSDRILVTTGKHQFDIVSDKLGYHARREVTVTPGKVSAIRLEWPKGSLALNAQPWADVWINGERVGETPIGNISLPIGTHLVTFRHPELGEQTVSATVTASNPSRVTVDMRKR